MKKFYLASGLENISQACELIDTLKQEGWTCTYDWTEHGSLQGKGNERLGRCAAKETQGVADANVVIVVLPGARGTHVELGVALGLGRPVIIVSNNFSRDFDNSKRDNYCCAFYHHPAVVARLDGPKKLIVTAEQVYKRFYEVKDAY